MRPMFLASLLAMTTAASPSFANGDDPLAQYLWQARPIVVFAPSEFDPRFVQQMEWLEEDAAALEERDVVVLTDVDPATKSALRERFRPRDFQLLLIGKDGQIKQRKPFPWDVRELSRVIDKMPMRQQEMRRARDRPRDPVPEPVEDTEDTVVEAEVEAEGAAESADQDAVTPEATLNQSE